MIRKMKRQWEREYLKRQVPAILACLLYFGASLPAWAAPTGGVITAGSATISSSGVTTTINQASNKAAINWQSFGIAKGETVNFVQPSASSIALNRVIGSDASAIYGTLSANGQVFLINPNGILFAPGAQVNVAGLVASTLNISDSDFLNGNYRFSKDGQAGSVINQGNITASNGYVAFLGPQVKNEGIIAAKVIGMTAGDKVSLDFNGDNLLKLTVDTIAAGASSSNSGSLLADGGTVLMSTGTKDALLSTVVNNSGLIQARTVNNISGTIILEGGSANISGTLDASAPTGGNGGFIETSGASVTMAPDLHVTTLASQGQTGTWLIDPTDYTIGTGPTGMNYWNNETLGTALASSDIIVQTDNSTGSDSGDINVLAPVSWSAHKLTLSAYRNINIRSTLSATGSSSLEMTSGSGGTIDYGLTASGFAGKVNFGARSGSGFLTINGNDYTVITSLGAAGSTSKTDLQGMSGDLLGKYYLGADINASSTSTWNSGAGFAPIGDFLDKFVGVFDGGGHTISGLTINRPTTNHVGLFGMTSGGKLGNLSLVNAGIIGNKFAGSLAGEVTNTQITKISATALVTIVDVDGTSAAGGLVGSNSGTISNSYANGSVTGNTQSVNAGGLAGNNSGSISSSYANGSVLGIGDAGGLVGSNTGSISNSYATGNVTGNSSNPQFSAGGLVGKNNGSISSSYATGMVSGSRVGGLVGAKLVSGSTTTSYWDKDTSGMTTSVGGSGRTTTELMSGLPTGFSSDVWGIIPGTSYPYLKWSHPTTPQVVSGFVKDASGATQAGQTVQTLGNGNLVGSASSGANGFYYQLLGNGSIANNAPVLSYVNASGSAARYATAVNQSLTGFDITADRVTATSGGVLDVTVLLASAKGSNTDNTLYTKNGSLLTVNNDLYVTAGGNVSQTGALDLKVNGATNVDAGTNNIILGNSTNDFVGAVSLTGQNVTLRDANALTLGTSTVSGNLVFNAGGTVSQTGALTVSGTTTANAGANDINLNNTSNNFTGAVLLTGNNATLTDANELALGNSNISGNLVVNAGGTVSQTGALTVSGTTTANAGANDINLNNTSNNFTGAVLLTGNNATLTDANELELGNFNISGNLVVNAGGTVSQTGGGVLAVTGTTTVSAKSSDDSTKYNINLNSSVNQLAGAINATGANLNIMNAGAAGTSLNALSATGDVLVRSTAGLSIVNGGAVTSTGGDVFLVAGGNFINNGGSSAVSAGTGKSWQIYSNGPADDVQGSLDYSFTQYGTSYLGDVTGSGNGFVYSQALNLSANLTGSVEKVYNGNNTATVTSDKITVAGLSGAAYTVAVGAGSTYDNKNAGSGKTVTTGTVTVSGVTDSNSKPVYGYSYTPTSLSANVGVITPASLTLAAVSGSKVYNGSTVSTAASTVTAGTLYDVGTLTQNYDNKNVGTGKTLTPSIIFTDPANANNYTITLQNSTGGEITAKALTASLTGTAEKVYDGTLNATLTGANYSLAGLIGGDAVSATGTSVAYADKNVNTGITVTATGLSISGADAGNYTISGDAAGSIGVITARPLTALSQRPTRSMTAPPPPPSAAASPWAT